MRRLREAAWLFARLIFLRRRETAFPGAGKTYTIFFDSE